MKLVTTKHIFIKSDNIVGKPYDFRILLGDSFLRREQEYHRMQLTLTRFASYVDWYAINDTNNTFNIGDITYVIPSGNYPYKVLALVLTSLYSGWTVTYDTFTNKLLMVFTEPQSISFTGYSYKVLGFSNNEPQTSDFVGDKHIIKSNYMLKAGTGDDRIIVQVRDVTPASGYNYDNYKSSTFQTTRILCNIPLNSPPYTVLLYRDDGDNMSLLVTDSVLKRIRIVLTNDDDELLTYITNFHMVLKVDIYDIRENNEELIPVLKEMSEYSKLNFLSSNLK